MAITEPRLDYLGRGVDCRTPPETWLDTLDHYSAEKIRHINNKNINEMQISKKESRSKCSKKTSRCQFKAKLHFKPHEVLKLGGELKAKQCVSNTDEVHINHHGSRVVTMLDDTSNDPDIITREGSHYIRYECQLIQFILKHIEREKHKANTKSSDATGTDKTENLREDDAVAKLHDLMARAETQSRQQLWQMIADACCQFLQERKHTHYVYNIELGASSRKVEETHESDRDISAKLQGKVMDYAAAIGARFRNEDKSTHTTEKKRGRINSHGKVIEEEVIEADLKLVTELINTPELKIIMQKLLNCYNRGPFRISCRITSGREHIIYWQVVGNEEIHGTTEEDEASNFYTRHTDKGFHIYHLTEGTGTELFVTVQQRDSPLKLTPTAHNKQHFKLKDNTQSEVPVPLRELNWTTKSPFFIKQSTSLIPRTRYVAITECGTNSNNKVNEDEDSNSTNSKPTYKTATNKIMNDGDDHQLMLFYFEQTLQVDDEVSVALRDVGRPGSSHIESDSTMEQKVCPSKQLEDVDCAFTELVGNHYIFPIQV